MSKFPSALARMFYELAGGKATNVPSGAMVSGRPRPGSIDQSPGPIPQWSIARQGFVSTVKLILLNRRRRPISMRISLIPWRRSIALVTSERSSLRLCRFV